MTTVERVSIVAQRFLSGAGQVDREVAEMQALIIVDQSGRQPEAVLLDVACELVKAKVAFAVAQRGRQQK